MSIEEKVFVSEPAYDWFYFLSPLISLLNLAVLIIVVFAIVKLYRKLIKFLDKNS